MGITFKEFAWLIEPNRLSDSNIYGGVNGCPGGYRRRGKQIT